MTLVDNGKGVNWNPSATTIAAIAKLTAPARITASRTTAFQKRVWQMGDVVIDSYRIASNGEIVLKLYDVPRDVHERVPPVARVHDVERDVAQGEVKARNGFVNTCPKATKSGTCSARALHCSASATGTRSRRRPARCRTAPSCARSSV